MKPSKDLPRLLQHHSPIKQVTNFYTDPCWERLRLCRREHLGTKPCSSMPFIPKRASHSYSLFLKCAQECLIQKSLHLLPACQEMSFLTSVPLLPHPALRSDVISELSSHPVLNSYCPPVLPYSCIFPIYILNCFIFLHTIDYHL